MFQDAVCNWQFNKRMFTQLTVATKATFCHFFYIQTLSIENGEVMPQPALGLLCFI